MHECDRLWCWWKFGITLGMGAVIMGPFVVWTACAGSWSTAAALTGIMLFAACMTTITPDDFAP